MDEGIQEPNHFPQSQCRELKAPSEKHGVVKVKYR